MIARRIRLMYVSTKLLGSKEGWLAPDGWRIVNSEAQGEKIDGEHVALVTLVKS